MSSCELRKIKGQKAALVIVYHIVSLRVVEIILFSRKNKGTGGVGGGGEMLSEC